MKIQILAHSQTGNTLQVANAIQLNLDPDGHTVVLTHIKADDERSLDPDRIKISALPNVKDADLIVLGGPVRGFAPSAAVIKTIKGLNGFSGKPVMLYVTEFFPFDFMGGKRALESMKRLVEGRGGKVVETRIIHWYNWGRNLKILKFVHFIKGWIKSNA